MKLPIADFQLLYSQIVERFTKAYETEYESQPNETQIFDLPGSDPDRLNLAKAVMHSPMVKAHLRELEKANSNPVKFNAKYLYQKKRQLERTQADGNDLREVQINAPYDTLLFLYLGFADYKAYLQSQHANEVEYRGYYYSYVNHAVRTFSLFINYKLNPKFPGVQLKQYYARESGYHDKVGDPEYKGYAYLLEGKLHVTLYNEQSEDRLRIFIEAGSNPSELVTMRGSINAVSSFIGRPLTSVETVLLRKDAPSITPEDHIRIKRYLILHGNNFRINERPVNLQKMEIKKVSVDVLRHLVGLWRVFRFGSGRQEVVSSLIWVLEDYRAYCFTDYYDAPNLNEQVCLMDITTIHELFSRTISLNCYPKEGAQLLSASMIDIPRKEDTQLSGVITFVGQDGRPPTMRALLLRRAPELWKQVENPAELSTSEKKVSLLKLVKNNEFKISGNTDKIKEELEKMDEDRMA